MWRIVIDICGWIGAIAYLVAFLLVSTRKLTGDSSFFQLLNLLGGVFLVINSIYYLVWPSVAVNAAWAAIALTILLKNQVTKNRRDAN